MAAPTAGTGTSLDDLCDDSVTDVLVRLPSQACLAVASAVCKRLRRFRHYQDLQILDHRGGQLLLKPRKYNHLFLYNLLTGQHAKLKWPPGEVFSNMTGFLLDGGNIVFVCKNEPKANAHVRPRRASDHSVLYSACTGEWQPVQPSCRDTDAARYATCRHMLHDVTWSQCVGEVVYSRYSSHVVGPCLVALDTRTMSRSIVTLPRYLQRIPWKKPPRNFTLMETDDRGNIGLVAANEFMFILRVWLRHEEGDDTAATGEGKEWMLFRKVVLLGLANRVAEHYDVHLNALQVVTAYSGTVHLRLVVVPEKQGKHCFFFAAKEQEQGEGSFYFFASLNLASMEFSNEQSETVCKEDRFYPFTLCCPPFLPQVMMKQIIKINANGMAQCIISLIGTEEKINVVYRSLLVLFQQNFCLS
ncbi:uncharacterized protein C2845_PM07G12560 [Panicum miliaceum]|uniref:F-box domain-containing protein n=1 Tax=Panicum miliaceum TaxID=4540 RepID=A0A3L6SL85_PANMI|nr:uncharacterized protein C2845_PM07G12560 [Panicum miliaceum]